MGRILAWMLYFLGAFSGLAGSILLLQSNNWGWFCLVVATVFLVVALSVRSKPLRGTFGFRLSLSVFIWSLTVAILVLHWSSFDISSYTVPIEIAVIAGLLVSLFPERLP